MDSPYLSTASRALYPKYILYTLFILTSWLLSCLLHFQLHRSPADVPALLVLPIALDAFLSPPAATDADQRRRRSCRGRSVYVLDLPARFNVLSSCSNGSAGGICAYLSNAGLGPALTGGYDSGGVLPTTGWYHTDQYSLEVIFHNRMRQYECLTGDPAEATAVYVPYYPGLELHRHLCRFENRVRDAMSADFLRWLSSQPSWAAFGGRDHFMMAAKTTWMFRVNSGGCGNRFLTLPESKNMTMFVYESNPWNRSDFAVPYPSYFHPSNADEVAAWQARARAAKRKWLFAFAGARRPNGTLAIRDRIIDACESSLRGRLLDCSYGFEGYTNCRTPQRLMALFASTTFCLQPRGDSFMRRSSVDAVLAGCIPVFFEEASTFRSQYLWHAPPGEESQYSVYIPSDDVVDGKVKIEEALMRYTEEEVVAMREEVIKMMPMFFYKDPRVSFGGDDGMRDAFDMAIDGVMERMRRIKGGEEDGNDM